MPCMSVRDSQKWFLILSRDRVMPVERLATSHRTGAYGRGGVSTSTSVTIVRRANGEKLLQNNIERASPAVPAIKRMMPIALMSIPATTNFTPQTQIAPNTITTKLSPMLPLAGMMILLSSVAEACPFGKPLKVQRIATPVILPLRVIVSASNDPT